ncbi:glutamine synthetase family protein [Herbiconiux moechotypicola]|uniref:Glutamine synthetase family protein n=1 Tax=Herbiconiux moechotypicola TaxID=637393 RepID=A0ABN3DPS2_9MICO|nr:glutamine synthetase family protein [Herbiconiux moechotypicola]MCS5731709.1 glutamine synthetase family protein [Herbiconiux moechotypicola]
MSGERDIIVGSIVDLSGVVRAKAVPAARAEAFESVGMGASPSWNVFCVDDQTAFTPTFSVTGDLRMRVDRSRLREIAEGVRWAPGTFHTQDGAVAAVCTRSALERQVERMRDRGLEALVGHEVEFVLDEAVPRERWSAYGLGSLLESRGFVADLLEAADRAGLEVAQVHAEYGPDQYEVSLAPRPPVEAADDLVLARILISQTARLHGLTASFSPVPAAGGSSNGAHQHLSFSRAGVPLISGGAEVHGLTDDGAAAIAGVLARLPEVLAVLSGSVLSTLRLRPGMWAGAYGCWGLENREAAVRLCAVTQGTPEATVEVKCIDPSANPYLATAVLLAAAIDGIETRAVLPPEVTVDPQLLAEAEREAAGVRLLAGQTGARLEAFARSPFAAATLGAEIVEALVAVRSREDDTYGAVDPATVTTRLRYAWTC